MIVINLKDLINQEKHQFEANLKDNIYKSVSDELKLGNFPFLLYYNNKLIEKNFAFQGLNTANNWELIYVNGNTLLEYFNQNLQQSQQIGQEEVSSSIYKKCSFSSGSIESSLAQLNKFDQIMQYQRQKHQEEIEKLNEISTRSKLNISQSIGQTQIGYCHFCNSWLAGSYYQTPCQHNFHAECLELVLKFQLDRKYVQFKCQCEKQLRKRAFFQIFKNPFQADFYFLQLIQNQLDEILRLKQSNYQSCANNCGFFIILTNQENIQNNIHFCPQCCQNTNFIDTHEAQ